MYFFIYKNKDNYYYKYKGRAYYYTHPLGFKNQYGHEIILIIPVTENLVRNKLSLSRLIIKFNKKLIRFLEKINRKI